MKIYLARAMTGKSYDEIKEYYDRFQDILVSKFGEMISVHCPIACKEKLKGTNKIKAHNQEGSPITTDHAILQRDLWMVARSDIVFVNFTDTTEISIGCCMELAVAHWLRKYTIVVLPKKNIHTHAFVLESADIIFTNENEAISYLERLIYSIGR